MPTLTARALTSTLVAALVMSAAPAAAQSTRSGGGASAQAVRQLQQLASERTALQAENANLKKQVDELKAKLTKAESESGSLRGRAAGADAAIARARSSTEGLEAEIERRRQRETELVAEFRKTVESLRTIEGERNASRAEAQSASRALDTCAQSNAELATIALDVLARYEGAGIGHAFSKSEPFTRLTRTRVENLVDEYRARAEELRVRAPGEAAATP